MGILDTLPGKIAGALDGLMRDATLTQFAKATDNRGGRTEDDGTDYDIRALVTEYSEFTRSLAGGRIAVSDRKAIVLANGLAVNPKIGDAFTQGATWNVVDVSSDPARATFELHLRPKSAA